MKKIAWIFSLILCLGTFFIAPSAWASETWEITSPYLRFQGGTLNYSQNGYAATWNINFGTGERKFIAHVDFPEPYFIEPNVVVYLTGIDADNFANGRITVKPINVTAKGFDVEYKTWADSRVYLVASNWTAFGE